jgi:hypothetical protein
MAAPRVQELPIVDEGSWAYLIGSKGQGDADALRERVVAVCEESGWGAVGWSFVAAGHGGEPGNLFEGLRHAVEHADVVVALLGATGQADAELAMAYGHRRPIVGIRFADADAPISETQSMLESYERARVIACEDIDGCAAGLRDVLSDPDFAATIHVAAGERVEDE